MRKYIFLTLNIDVIFFHAYRVIKDPNVKIDQLTYTFTTEQMLTPNTKRSTNATILNLMTFQFRKILSLLL